MQIKKIFSALMSGAFKGHFGQYAEDALVRKLFDFKHRKGNYIDLGAYHPFRFSNTAFFWMRDWQGINVDANPKTIELFKKTRKKDLNLWAAVITQQEFDSGTKHINLMLPEKSDRYGLSAIGTVSKEQAEQNGMKTLVSVPTTTINNIFKKNHIVKLDFLNIDLEGYDEKVILDFDFKFCKPKIIAIEIFSKSVCETTANLTVAHIKKQGYRLHAVAGYTAIFVLLD